MRIPKRFKLHLAAGHDTAELQLEVLRIKAGTIRATDCTIAAEVPLAANTVRPGAGEALAAGALIEPRAWADATRGSKGEGELRLDEKMQVVVSEHKAELHFLPPPRGPAPDIDLLFELAFSAGTKGDRPAEITLNAEALHRLSQALGAEKQEVRLRFYVDDRGRATPDPVAVLPADGNGARGVILPVMTEGREG